MGSESFQPSGNSPAIRRLSSFASSGYWAWFVARGEGEKASVGRGGGIVEKIGELLGYQYWYTRLGALCLACELN